MIVGRADTLYFWRDRRGSEVDLLIADGMCLIPVEINSGVTLSGEFLRGLDRFAEFAGKESHDLAWCARHGLEGSGRSV